MTMTKRGASLSLPNRSNSNSDTSNAASSAGRWRIRCFRQMADGTSTRANWLTMSRVRMARMAS